jgi:MFS family permease
LKDTESDCAAIQGMESDDASSHSKDSHESRNFLALVVYQILLRTGWIFKTESIIMPAVLDTLSGAGWVRGWLPVLNRFGYSIPPMLMARRIKVMKRKKWSLFATTVYMSLSFLGMAGMFWLDRRHFESWLPTIFLVLYAIFFVAMGVNQLSFNTLQGKLIPPTRRGRLLLVSNTIGAVTAIACAFWLLPQWLTPGRPQFDMIFGFSGILFAVSCLAVLFTIEMPDDFSEPAAAVHHYFLDSLRVLRKDATFRRLAFVGAMYGSSIMLFPHYQNLGLQGMKLELSNVMWWVVVQNVGTGLFSIPAGPIADRFGNRLVLRIGLLCIVAAPLLAIAVFYQASQATLLFNLVFFCVGVTPVVLRTFQNFALELSEPADHPRYLSTISLVIAAPIVLSPLAGWLVDRLGHPAVFMAVAVAVLLGWLATFGLDEPRHGTSSRSQAPPGNAMTGGSASAKR